MHPNPHIQKILEKVELQAQTAVWWSSSQRARGDHLRNDPTQGERAWIIPSSTGKFLYDLIQKHHPHTVLELGTSLGYSTLWIASALDAQAHLFSIDKNPEKHALAKGFLAEAQLDDHVSLLTGTIAEQLMQNISLFSQGIDMIFLDADRGHYHEYFDIFESYLSREVILVADNAINMQSRMRPFIELLASKDFSVTILDQDHGILVAQKNLHTS
jgi:predicted O-methyltransferase YrrM